MIKLKLSKLMCLCFILTYICHCFFLSTILCIYQGFCQCILFNFNFCHCIVNNLLCIYTQVYIAQSNRNWSRGMFCKPQLFFLFIFDFIATQYFIFKYNFQCYTATTISQSPVGSLLEVSNCCLHVSIRQKH